MSRNKLWLRLRGDLPPSEELTQILDTTPTTDRRRGSPIRGTGEAQRADVWSVELIRRDHWSRNRPDDDALAQAVMKLQRMAPGLTSLDRERCQAELYLSSIREEEQGGFAVPAELVAAAALANLPLSVSILVLLSTDDENGQEE
jgi:hypothetical protein